MQRDALLTQDELDFIQTMQHNPQLNVRDATSSLLVNGGSQIRDLLTRLAAHEQVTLQACLLYTSPSPRDRTRSRMPSSA